jgi:rRNA biogenesis protein RRP5
MASVKRKTGPTNESFVRSKKHTDNDGPPSKRLRQEDAGARVSKGDRDNRPILSSATLQAPKVSKLKGEEIAFPRGGASVLTPLEHKQIHIEAKQDVLFEQQSASRDQEARKNEETGLVGLEKSSKKRKSKAKASKEIHKEEAEEASIKIEGLSYKVLLTSKVSYLL